MSIIKRARWKDPSGKVTDYDLGANAANVSQDSTHRFVSDTEKNNWNAKLGSTGDGSNLISKFTQASSRTNLVSGEKDSASKGKIMKFFADLKAVAFSGSYNDLSNKPSIHSLANNCTTTAAGYGLDARQGKILQDQITQQSSDMRIKTVQKIHGNSQSGHVVINISFSTDNGCVTLLVSAGRFLLFISVELDLVTSTLSPNGVEYYSPYSGGKEIKSVVATSAIPGSYRVKITTDAIITAYDVVAISGEIDNLQVGSAAG